MKIPVQYEEEICQYARLIVRTGVNLQPGQELVVRAPVEAYEFVRLITKEGYGAGAKEVIVHWSDSIINRERLLYAAEDAVASVPEWKAASMNDYAARGAAFISLTGEDPEAYRGVDSARLLVSSKASNQAWNYFYEQMTASIVPWTVAAVPCGKWAARVFPEMTQEEAEEKLWKKILQTVRISGGNPETAWAEHEKQLRAHCDWMNDKQFVRLHYRNRLGTDFTVGLVKNHIWEGGSEACGSGVRFQSNLPTEEIFTMPDRNAAEGTLVASMPLSYQGSMVENFSLTFREGRVVDYTAQTGAEVLKRILDSDEASGHLGEVALVPYSSPVRRQNILFYNTLFDENAACHFALGECYPTTVAGGASMSREELIAAGGNAGAINHVDFMIGTEDLTITGITESGEEIPVFEKGEFAF